MTELDQNMKVLLLAELNKSIKAMREYRAEGDKVEVAREKGFTNGIRVALEYFGYITESRRGRYGDVEKYTDIRSKE